MKIALTILATALTFAIVLASMHYLSPAPALECKFTEKANFDAQTDEWSPGWTCPEVVGPTQRILIAGAITAGIGGIGMAAYATGSHYSIRRKELENAHDRDVIRRGIGN